MSEIVPRWEWRTFGDRFRTADAVFAQHEPTQVHESDELYLLAPGANNVKIRDDLMDIKVLREVDANGLERWEPILKAAFPLSPEDVRTVMGALGLPVPEPATALSRAAFRDVLRSTGAGVVRPVDVHKHRIRYRVGDGMAERSEVHAAGRSTWTIAVESPDAEAVYRAVEVLGFADYLNMSYEVGLADMLDDIPPRFAVIDVGTNSVKFHVAEHRSDDTWATLVDRADVTRLGEGMADGGRITTPALERTVEAIAGMVDEARRARVVAIAAVGTEAIRSAANAVDVRAAIRARTRVRVDAIPGEEEARLAYVAAVSSLGLRGDGLAVFDTGGGSSQFTFGDGTRIEEQFSVPVGAARFTERFGLDRAVSRETVDEALAAIATELGRLDGRARPAALVGMGGTLTNMSAVKHELATYDPDRVQGTVLDRPEIERQIERYRSTDADGRRGIEGLQPKRAEVILAGACIVRTIMDRLGADSVTVSDRGLRHGLLVERFGGQEGSA
jgi:exopolyphosphatase / guanosine-5'-triphosphate,3'-diphosphate pyrophosphatase